MLDLTGYEDFARPTREGSTGGGSRREGERKKTQEQRDLVSDRRATVPDLEKFLGEL
jgi:hypothetical protein